MILDLYNVGARSRALAFQVTTVGPPVVRIHGPIGQRYLIDSIALSGLGATAGQWNWQLFVSDNNDPTLQPTLPSGDPVYGYRGPTNPGLILQPFLNHAQDILLYPRYPVRRAPTYLKLYINSAANNQSFSVVVNIIPDFGTL